LKLGEILYSAAAKTPNVIFYILTGESLKNQEELIQKSGEIRDKKRRIARLKFE